MKNLSRLLKNKSLWLALVVVVLALLPRVTTISGTFIVNDEPLYWDWSNDFTNALLKGDWRGTMIGIGYPSVLVVWVHTLSFAAQYLFDVLRGQPMADFAHRVALDQPMVFAMLGQRRLAMGLVNAVLVLLIFVRARRLLGEGIAFLGAGLMALSPFLLADARTMRGDAMMSSLMLLSVLEFLLFLREQRRWILVWSGVAFGLALLTKMTALPLAGLTGLAVLVYGLWQPWTWVTRLRWGFTTLAIWGVVAGLTFFALWPALWVAPVDVFVFMRDYAASSIDGRINYFWGNLTSDEPLPLFYPTAFLFRANPIVVCGVIVITVLTLLSAWRWLRAWRQKRGVNLDELWQMPGVARWTLIALGAYAAIYGLAINVGALKRDRYLMPIFPAALFIAAAGLLWLVRWLGQRWPGSKLPRLLSRGRWVWVILTVWLGLELAQILSTHPFYYTYWSPLLGGGRTAMTAMMAEGGIDSAGVVYADHLPNASHETLALLTGRDYAPAYSGKVVRLSNNSPWITANHVLLRQFHYQTEKMEPYLLEYLYRRPPEYVAEFQGYTWAWIYPGPAAQYYAGSRLDGQAELMGYNLSSQQASFDQPLQLKLFWQNDGYQPPAYFFVRLVDPAGFVWAAATAQPLPDFQAVTAKYQAIVESEARLNIPPGTPPGVYALKMGLADDEGTIGEFTLPTAANQIVVAPPANSPAASPARPMNQSLGALTLLGADLPPTLVLTPPTSPVLTLYWQAGEAISQNYQISVRLMDSSGQEAAVWSGPPARGLYPSSNWRPGELIRDPWTLDLAQAPRPVAPGRYTIAVAVVKAGTKQEVGQAMLGEIEVIDRLRLFTPPAITHRVDARLGQSIALLGYDLVQAPLTGGARFKLKLYWQALTPIPTNYTVFVQVLGPDGTVVGQHDGVPAGGVLPTTAWSAGEIVPDRHLVDFSTIQNGDYRLIVGMYDPATGARLPITDTTGAPGGDFVPLYILGLKN